MAAIQVAANVYWVGAIDWNVRHFHGHTYTTKRGTTYNAYLIVDEKIALVDAVYAPFSEELLAHISEIVDPKKIDYIIANHVETDHSGAIPTVKDIAKNAQIVCSAKCKEGLEKHYFGNWDYRIVKTGDTLKLGKKTLSFVEAPMIHWPDSMFTYIPEDKLLLPNDAFGQHYATSERFDDQVDQSILMEEAKKYYANILTPLGSIILKKLEEVQKMNIPITTIAPSHGIIWRKDPGKIINAYLSWAKNETQPKIVVVFETMWGATEKMARKITEGIMDEGVAVKLYDIAQSDRTEIVAEMLDARGYLIGSSTHDNDMLTSIAGFLEFVKGLKPRNRMAAVFGSYGWAGGAVISMESILKEAGIAIGQPSLAVKYVPTDKELGSCYEFGRVFAQKIKGGINGTD